MSIEPGIDSLCREIMEQLTLLGRNTSSAMLPGISEATVRKLTAKLPFKLVTAHTSS